MTELNVKITKGLVKRAAAVVMAICLGATAIPADVLATTKFESCTCKTAYDPDNGYAPCEVYDPYCGTEDGYRPCAYDPETGVYTPCNKTPYGYEPCTCDKKNPYSPYNPYNPEGIYAPSIKGLTPKTLSIEIGTADALTYEIERPEGSKVETQVFVSSSDKEKVMIEKTESTGDEGTIYVRGVSKGTVAITVQLRTEGGLVIDEAVSYVNARVKGTPIPDPFPTPDDVKPGDKDDKNDSTTDKDDKNDSTTDKDDKNDNTDKDNGQTTPVAVAEVKLDKTTLTFDTLGASETLTATVTPADATNKTVTWATDNAAVATVADGKVTAVGNGEATITATADGKVAKATVKVSQKSEKVTITLNGQTVKGTLKAKVKKSYKFKAVVTPEDTAKENAVVTWKSSNSKVAKVTKSGKVTIKKKGKVTITATTADGTKASIKLNAGTKAVKVKKLTIVGSKTMKVKKTQTLKVNVTPATADNTKVTWKSSNKKVATVNKNGKVTAKKKGSAKITATAKDGSKKKVIFKITVKK